jgi:N-acylglucosamine-6-phosphate 2-epimerase
VTLPASIAALRHRLIVSCQADPGDPLDDPTIMAAMAQVVVKGGAAAIRANGPANIQAIRQVVDVPIFGIWKVDYSDSPVYITPTIDDARQVAAAGCDVLTVDATRQSRPNNETLADYFKALKNEFNLPLMADVSTVDEGLQAADLGADLVATTLAGYTPYSLQSDQPDFQLVSDLAYRLDIPVILEGRVRSPDHVREALRHGAFAVVVGSMITRPAAITAYFVGGLVE